MRSAALLFAFISITSLLTMSFAKHPNDPVGGFEGRPPWVKAGGEIIQRVAKDLSLKYHMTVIGSGGGLMENIETLYLCFQIDCPLSVEEARKLIVECTDYMIAEMNRNEKARPFLKHYPASEDMVEIVIIIADQDGHELYHPEISLASSREGRVAFRTRESQYPWPYKLRIDETYEEAKAKVEAAS